MRTRKNRKFDFDLDNNAPSNSVFFCRSNPDGTIVEVEGNAMLGYLKQSGYRQLLLNIHGLSNMPDDVFAAVEEFLGLCDKGKKDEVIW